MKIELENSNYVEVTLGPEKQSVRLRVFRASNLNTSTSEIPLTAREASKLVDCLHEAVRTVNAHTKAQR